MKRKGKPLDFHYLSHQTCDGKFGLITSVCVTAGNVRDSTVHSKEICIEIDRFNFKTEVICADSGYNSSEIHKDMLDRGIQTHIVKRNRVKESSEKFTTLDFVYQEETDLFICPNGETLLFCDYRAN
ncbi:MAG: transposase [Eubacteriales bacterium]